ncbi:hypothetical protein WOLCODRAFT_112452 [Wolfiporia cocos MD-104 SS10]|uniref:F-box domain-containing protein n=1 Tax=Wolfiporia cocos (strain MD-104) TaxID=742152 RepID=A0A2H3IUV7_WOLCO|nr:hypothetical protein WOLCODRAFT_112452 [Wolfiporia cocos MD-104 SS10]
MPFLPPEISDYILDYLHDDTRSLAACSLTCRDWVPTARYHLFASVTLHSARLCAAFANLVQRSPLIAPYVRELNVSKLSKHAESDSLLVERTLRTILTRLEQTHTLSVSLLNAQSIAIMQSSLTRNPSVTELHLQFCEFATFGDVIDLLSAFPELESLALRGVSWGDASLGHHAPRATSFPKLRKLRLGRDVDTSTLLDFVLCGSHHRSITELAACCTSEDGAAAVGALIENIGPSLRHLELEWCPSRLDVDAIFLPRALSPRPRSALESVSLRCVIPQDCSIPWVNAFLFDLESARIKQIAVEIRLLGDLDALNWEEFQKMLSEARFGGLEKVLVKVNLWSGVPLDKQEVKDILRKKLLNLEARGILHLA